MNDIMAIAAKFPLDGKPFEYSQIKTGHINETYPCHTSYSFDYYIIRHKHIQRYGCVNMEDYP